MIEIKFDTDNASFEEDEDGEIERVIDSAIDLILDGHTAHDLYDINGNVIGYIYRDDSASIMDEDK